MWNRFTILMMVAFIGVLLGAVACSKTEGGKIAVNDKQVKQDLGYVPCKSDVDCKPANCVTKEEGGTCKPLAFCEMAHEPEGCMEFCRKLSGCGASYPVDSCELFCSDASYFSFLGDPATFCCGALDTCPDMNACILGGGASCAEEAPAEESQIEGWCSSECRKQEDCWLMLPDCKGIKTDAECAAWTGAPCRTGEWVCPSNRAYECETNGRCQFKPLFPYDPSENLPDGDEDGDVDGDGEVDGDSDGPACVPGTEIGQDCLYRTKEECAEYFWPELCGSRDCFYQGWRYECNPEGKCVDTCDQGLGQPEPGSAAEDYVGIWAGFFTTAVRTTGLPLVPYQDTVSGHHTLVRVRVDESGNLVFEHKLCFLGIYNFKDDQIFETDIAYMVVPRAYMENVATVVQTVENPPAYAPGATFETSRFYEARGAKVDPTDPDSLPNRDEYLAGAESVWDQDFDEKPGMTTLMNGALNGEVYSDQVWSTVMKAEIVDQNHIKGINSHTNRQHQLDASIQALVYEIDTVAHPDEDRSYFRLLRLDDLDATCDDVMDMAEEEDGWLTLTPHLDDVTPD